MVTGEVYVICYGTILISLLKQKRKFARYLTKISGAGAGAGAEIRICVSMEPEPKEIFSAPQHCS
jgi:hypothetical protein